MINLGISRESGPTQPSITLPTICLEQLDFMIGIWTKNSECGCVQKEIISEKATVLPASAGFTTMIVQDGQWKPSDSRGGSKGSAFGDLGG